MRFRRGALTVCLAMLASSIAIADAGTPPSETAEDLARDRPSVPPVPIPSKAPDDPTPAVPRDAISDVPPPSAYDRARGLNGKLPEPPDSITGQLFKTLFALGAVVGFIYLLFRFGPAKFLLARQGASNGKLVRIVERIAVDQKSALLVIDVGNERLLIGAGESGMSVLTRMDPNASVAPTAPPGRSFISVFDGLRAKTNEDNDAPK